MSSRSSRWTLDLCVVVTWQLVICAIVRGSGFRAISDDDYARVVIAAEFVNRASWDPSGTSWLPFPFLLNGSLMSIFGGELAVARAAAVASAVLTALLLYAAARLLACSRNWAVIGSCAGASLTYSALLSVSTVPEYLNAGFLVFAASTLATKNARQRGWGALSVTFACASRYESWPVAGVFALVSLYDAWKHRAPAQRNAFLIPAVLSCAFPLVWLAHGVMDHGNALFFVTRVVDYKRALGDALPSLEQLMLGTPRALLFAEPEPVLAALSAWLIGRRFASTSNSQPQLWRAWIPLAAMVATLLVGEARGGAPTHHSERALLSCWLLFTLTTTALLSRVPHNKLRPMLFAALAAIVLGGVIRHSEFLFVRQPMINRLEEELIGREIEARKIQGQIALATPDYGYFAVMASAGDPKRFLVIERHDPRELKPLEPETLHTWLKKGGCFYVSDIASAKKADLTIFSTNRLGLRVSSTCR